MAVLWVGLVITLYGLVTEGAGADTPLAAAVVAWVLVVFFVVVIPVSAWTILRFRTVLDAAGGRVEREPGHVSVAVADLRELRALPPSTINRANRGARVQLLDADGRVVAQVDESMRRWPDALAVVRSWARSRPDLVHDDYSRERLLGAVDAS